MNNRTLLDIAVIGALGLATYYIIHVTSAKTAAATAATAKPVSPNNPGSALLQTAGSDLLGFIFGNGGNYGSTNSTAGTSVTQIPQGNPSSATTTDFADTLGYLGA